MATVLDSGAVLKVLERESNVLHSELILLSLTSWPTMIGISSLEIVKIYWKILSTILKLSINYAVFDLGKGIKHFSKPNSRNVIIQRT